MNARSILRNVGSNSLGYVVNVAVGLVLSPLINRSLGYAVAGVWSLVVSFVGYYGVLDVGIRSAVSHYVATYHARRDQVQVNRTLSTAMAMLAAVALVATLLTVAAAFWLPDWYARVRELRQATEVNPLDVFRDPATLRTVILVMGLGFAVNLPMVIYGTVIYSAQHLVLQNAIGIGQQILRALLTWLALRQGYGIVGLAVVVVGTNALGWVATIVGAHVVLPALEIAPRHANHGSARELLSYGGYNVLVNVGDTVLLYTSGFIIVGALGDESAVTYYSVPASQLIPYFMSIVQSVTWSFTPWFTARWATGMIDDVRRLLDVGSRGVVLLASLIAGGLWFLGGDFLRIWQPSDFASGEHSAYFGPSVTCLAILTGATLLRAAQSCGRQALFAMREVRYLGLLTLIEAGVNVALSIVLVRRFGLPGVAIGTLVPVLVTQGFVLPRHLLGELGADAPRFAWSLLRASVPVVATMALVDWAIGRFAGAALAVHSWPTFLARGTALAVPALVVGLFLGTSGDERRALVERLRA
jgi:O-antigen/teichoic acid export membrane protein